MIHYLKNIAIVGLMGSVVLTRAQVNSGSDGTDGAFNPGNTTTTVNLDAAPTSLWNASGSGNGVYDASKWAVVFKYSSVNIGPGKTVKFSNHHTNPPVVWLVQGNVVIDGIVDVSAPQTGLVLGQLSVPGPGGFRGGSTDAAGITRAEGFGPGGSGGPFIFNTAGGSYRTPAWGVNVGPTYGNDQIVPLIGGSGSRPHDTSNPPGAGGGAILIIAGGTITVNGHIYANGSAAHNWTPGSGGAIRLIATSISGAGTLEAKPLQVLNTSGGQGRIRLEAQNGTFGGTTFPDASYATLQGPNPKIWPDSTQPSVVVTSVDGSAVPPDPSSNFLAPDLTINQAQLNTITIQAYNIPIDETWRVQVRVVPRVGVDIVATASFVSGSPLASIWQAQLQFPSGGSAVIARAYKL